VVQFDNSPIGVLPVRIRLSSPVFTILRMNDLLRLDVDQLLSLSAQVIGHTLLRQLTAYYCHHGITTPSLKGDENPFHRYFGIITQNRYGKFIVNCSLLLDKYAHGAIGKLPIRGFGSASR